jgi:hypothetical protein
MVLTVKQLNNIKVIEYLECYDDNSWLHVKKTLSAPLNLAHPSQWCHFTRKKNIISPLYGAITLSYYYKFVTLLQKLMLIGCDGLYKRCNI